MRRVLVCRTRLRNDRYSPRSGIVPIRRRNIRQFMNFATRYWPATDAAVISDDASPPIRFYRADGGDDGIGHITPNGHHNNERWPLITTESPARSAFCALQPCMAALSPSW